ncbi:hypothetical protein MRB53_039306 [Persea americana]|nr:hypothetical protein MRB53_039306 [Persea americana]
MFRQGHATLLQRSIICAARKTKPRCDVRRVHTELLVGRTGRRYAIEGTLQEKPHNFCRSTKDTVFDTCHSIVLYRTVYRNSLEGLTGFVLLLLLRAIFHFTHTSPSLATLFPPSSSFSRHSSSLASIPVGLYLHHIALLDSTYQHHSAINASSGHHRPRHTRLHIHSTIVIFIDSSWP